MTAVWVVLALAAAVVLAGIVVYNRLVRQRNLVDEGWSGIETQLKRRADLIPNLVETVKGYATHERSAFEEVTELRTRALSARGVEQKAQAEGQLTAALGRLFAVAEAYPELKASANFQELQGALSETEDQIQLARRYYNGTVRDMNTMVQQFPSNIVANMFGFEEATFFEIEDARDRAAPRVSFGTS